MCPFSGGLRATGAAVACAFVGVQDDAGVDRRGVGLALHHCGVALHRGGLRGTWGVMKGLED